MTNEIWMPVVGYEGSYEVSNIGRVRSLDRVSINTRGFEQRRRGKILNAARTKGYPSVVLCVGGLPVSMKVHRLVADAFIPNTENSPMVNHIDGDKANNRVENLEWVTAKQNNDHSRYVLGNSLDGEANSHSKFTEKEVVLIRWLDVGATQLAEAFDVEPSTILFIKTRKHWKGVGHAAAA